MVNQRKTVTLLLAEDDDDDALLIMKVLDDSRLINKVIRVKDGEELMTYLHHEKQYSDKDEFPTPSLILLDLNMPKKDGKQALKEIKADPCLLRIPITILTTSKDEEDVIRSYDLGVNSFVTKPVRFEDFVKAIKAITTYWFEIVHLPNQK